MSEYVQALELQISDNASQAAKGLDALAQTLRGIKGAISKTANLGDVAKRITAFSREINGVASQDNITRMNKLASAIDRLVRATQGMQSVKGISKKVQEAATQSATTGMAMNTADTTTGLTDAKAQTMEIADNIKQSVTSSKELVANFRETNSPLDLAQKKLDQLTDKMATLLKSDNPDYGKISTVNKQIERTEEEIRKLKERADDAKQSADNLTNALHRIAAVPVETVGGAISEKGKQVSVDAFGLGGGKGGIITPFVDGVKNANHALKEQKENLRMSNEEAEALGRAMIEANGQIGLLNMQSKETATNLGKGIASGKMSLEQQAKMGLSVYNTDKRIQKLNEETEKTAILADNAMRFADAFLQANGYMGLSEMKIQEMKAELGRGLMTGTMSNEEAAALGLRITAAELTMEKRKEAEATAEAREQLRQYKEEQKLAAAAAKEAAATAKTYRDALRTLGKSFTGVLSGLKSFIRIAKYRMFRSLIREVTEGFSTGLENVRKYSEAIDGLYSKDMKGLDNTLLKMKNSLGAAVAPAIQALIPLFQRLANTVIDVSNVFNQFFALLNGATTWTRATNVEADALEDVDKAAAGAGRSMKNLLASWDELNIIQSESGGGGSGSKKEDLSKYLNMFEEVDTFDSKIRGIVDFLKDNIPLVEVAIGTLLAKIAGMSLGAAAMTVGVTLSYVRGENAGESGKTFLQSIQDDIPAILGATAGGAILGLSFGMKIGHPIGGAIVGLIAGASLSIGANLVGWIVGNDAAFNENSFIKGIRQDLENIIGPALLGGVIGFTYTGNVGGALIGASIGAAIGVFVSALNWKNDANSETAYNDISFTKYLRNNVFGILSTSAAFAAMGFHFTKTVQGAFLGAAAGLAISLFVTSLQWNLENKNYQVNALYGDIEEDAKTIEKKVKSYFRFDVEAFVNVTNTSVQSIAKKRDEVITNLNKVNGLHKILMQVGFENGDPATLGQEVANIVSDINEYLNLFQ